MGIAKYYKDNIQVKRTFTTRSISGAATVIWNPLYSMIALTISFTADHTISDSAGGFIVAGFKSGQTIIITDAGGFNCVTVIIDTCIAGVITTTSASPHVITKNATQSGSVSIISALTLKGFLNESAGGKQFQIGQNVVTSTGRLFLPINAEITALLITEKDHIYNVDSGKTFEILYDKKPNLSLINKIGFYVFDLRYVSI
jgi:hypothetical protein